MRQRSLRCAVLLLCGTAWNAAAAVPLLKTSTKVESPREGIAAVQQMDPKLITDDNSLEQNTFQSDTRIGFAFSSGNTDALALLGLDKTIWRIKRFEHAWRVGANYQAVYASTSTTNVGTAARHVFGTYRLDYYLTPHTTVYGGGGGYTDAVKGIDIAGHGFGGVAHYLVKNPAWYLRGALGYEFTHEERNDATRDETHAAAASLNYQQKFTETIRLNSTARLQQDLENLQDTRVTFENDFRVALVKHLDLSVGFTLRYSRDPVPGFKPLDTFTDVGIAVKF